MKSEKALEFDKIKEKLAEFAYTEKAREKIRLLEPIMVESEVRARLRETTEAKLMIEKCGNPPAVSLEGAAQWTDTADKGGCLTAEQLEGAAAALTAVKRLRDYLSRCRQYEIGLAYYDENLDALDEIRDAIQMKIRGGRVDDYASGLLKSLRANIEKTEDKMRIKADSVLKSGKAFMSDSFSTMRNGHVCVPVKKEYKYKIAGNVIDKSSTGSTLFIEPAASARCYEELQEMRLDEENEELRILYELTAMLADTSDVMRQNIGTTEKLDFIFAKAKLSIWYNGVEPEINTERYIRLVNARHPLMDPSVNVPLNFEIGNGINGIIITGPNTGGKTVAVKTVALNCLMSQCGLHTAGEKADICMNNRIYCDIGDGQDIENNLSTFSAHISHVLDILRRAGKESMVVIDELGSGTDPAEGMGIAVAVLDELKKSGAIYLVTTHYPEVKAYAEKETGVINARMTFDRESLKPMYQLVIGEAGESCAFYIARRLGMPGSMIRRAAEAAYGREAPDKMCGGDVKEELHRVHSGHIRPQKAARGIQKLSEKFCRGDSVMVYPDQKKGIVCEPVNEKGVLRVQLPGRKIWISHKRVRLLVAASELYPEDYDFSIIFETVEQRKMRHKMERMYVADDVLTYEEEG